MPKYLIEGSCDGSMFAESIVADTKEEAEAFAIERLCEAWGEEHEPDTTLDDLGDCANVTEYGPEDYAREAAGDMLESLQALVRQLVETSAYDDALNGNDPGLLADVAKAQIVIAAARGEA